ncbi:MAG: AAA family ATPase [Clostridia bacterium]|nr:AAA family ATPase [Clostridia bacterium]
MKLKKLEMYRFGKFRDTEVTLSEGLAALCQDNESGKTTMADFIRFMFYGFAKNRAKLTLRENFLERYQPWDSEDGVVGALEFEDESGETYRLERTQTAKGKTTVTVLDKDGKKLDIDAPGEYFLGVDSETFLNIFYITQGTNTPHRTAGMDVAMKNLVTTGSEEISFDQVMAALEKHRLKYSSPKGAGGKIKKLQDEIEETERFIAFEQVKLEEGFRQRTPAQKIKDRLAQIETESDELQQKLQQHSAYKAFLRQQKRAQLCEQIAALENQAAGEALSAEDAHSLEEMFRQKEQLIFKKEQEERNVSLLQEQMISLSQKEQIALQYRDALKTPPTFIIGLVAAAVALAAGIAAALWQPLCLIAGGVLAAIGAVIAIKARALPAAVRQGGIADRKELASQLQMALWQQSNIERQNGQLSAAKAQLSAVQKEIELLEERCLPLQQRTAVFERQDLSRLADTSAARLLARQRLQDVHTRLAEIEGDEAEDAKIANPTPPQGDAALLQKQQNLLIEEREQLLRTSADHAVEQRALESRQQALEERQAALQQMKEELAKAEAALEIVMIAIEAMTSAQQTLRDNYAPLLRQALEQKLSMLTDGKYQTVTLDEEFALRIKADGGLRAVDYFSAGTRDAAYLALRLSLAEIVEGEKCLPLIFDDPFLNLDEKRWNNLFSHLQELGKKRQILLLSCRKIG